jgi:hypothetical protein
MDCARLESGRRHSDSSVVDWELVKNLELADRLLTNPSRSRRVLARLALEALLGGAARARHSFESGGRQDRAATATRDTGSGVMVQA